MSNRYEKKIFLTCQAGYILSNIGKRLTRFWQVSLSMSSHAARQPALPRFSHRKRRRKLPRSSRNWRTIQRLSRRKIRQLISIEILFRSCHTVSARKMVLCSVRKTERKKTLGRGSATAQHWETLFTASVSRCSQRCVWMSAKRKKRRSF